MVNSKRLGRGFWALNITQFLGALNDNAFKMLIILLAIEIVTSQVQASRLIACASAAFILPFLLFSIYAGYLADKYSKTKIIIYTKALEVVVMVMGYFAFRYGNISIVIVCLFFMGTQSAFFGPSKYGILPEMLDEERLSMGNGLISMFTNIAIIIGMVCGTYLSSHLHGREYIASIYLIIISIVGLITSFFVTKMKPAGRKVIFRFNFLKEIINNLRMIKLSNKVLLYCIIGGAYFWFIAALYQSNILVYGKFLLEFSREETGFMLVLLAAGIGCGSLLAGLLGREKIEVGLIPIGAVFMSIVSLLLGFSYRHILYTMILFFLLGVSAGLFVVPISAFIQHRSPKERRGVILAVENFLSFTGILIGYGLFWVFTELFRSNPAEISIFGGFLTLLGIICVCKLIPEFLVRAVVWLMIHSVYRVNIVGRNKIPHQGSALLVCDCTSFTDLLFLLAATSRSIHFIVETGIDTISSYGWLFKLMKVDFLSKKTDRETLERSFVRARKRMENGKVVAVFSKAQSIEDKSLGVFGKGNTGLLEGLKIPLIPVQIDRKYGSIYKDIVWKRIGKYPRPVDLSFK